MERTCYIATPAHVVEKSPAKIHAFSKDGKRHRLAVVAVDEEKDIAMLSRKKKSGIPIVGAAARNYDPYFGNLCFSEGYSDGFVDEDRIASHVRGSQQQGHSGRIQMHRVVGVAGSIETIGVEITSVSVSEGSFTFVASDPELPVVQSDSGSMIMEHVSRGNLVPAGMVVNVNADGSAEAILMSSVLSHFMDSLSPIPKDLTLAPSSFTLERVERGWLLGNPPSRGDDPRTKTLTIDIDAGTRHRVLSGFRLKCRPALSRLTEKCRFSIQVYRTVDPGSNRGGWTQVRFRGAPTISRNPAPNFNFMEETTALKLRIQVKGPISLIEKIEVKTVD